MFRVVRPAATIPRAVALAALALTTALLAVSAMAPHAAAFADSGYSGGTNPEYTGKGASAVVESACAPDRCGFLTANGGRFLVGLPKGFVAKYQGTTAGTVDNMKVIAAMVRLPAAKYAPADQSVVPSGLSVAPTYAALLAKVGVTPTQFLDWQMGNVPPDKRMPWVPGWAPTGAVATTTTTTGTVTTPPTTTTTGTTTTKTPKVSGTKAVPASGTKSASGTASATRSVPTAPPPVTPTAATSESLASKSIHRGQAVANPTFCSKASSWVWNPAGDRCMPDTLLGVAPSAKPGTVVTVQNPVTEPRPPTTVPPRPAQTQHTAFWAGWSGFALIALAVGLAGMLGTMLVRSLRGLRTP